MRPRSGVVVLGPMPPPIHGAARVTERVVTNLRAAGGDPLVVDSSGSQSGSGARHHVARALLHLKAAGIVTRRRPRALYVTGAGGNGLWYQLLVVLAARLAGTAIFFHHHSWAYLSRPAKVMSLLTRTAGGRARHVVLCAGMGQRLRETYPAVTTTLVCSNAGLFAPAEEAPERTGDGDGLLIGHLGNLVAEKGLPLVFATLRALRQHEVPARLLLGGPVRTDEARRMLDDATAEFGDALDYLGPVAAHDVDDFYRRLDAFVFPSSYAHEAEPMVVLEAARLGVPSVAFRVGCLGALVPDPAALIDPGGDFADAASTVVAAWHGSGRAAVRTRVTDHFTELRTQATTAQDELVAALLEQPA